MAKLQTIDDSAAHKLPADLKKALAGAPAAVTAWNSLTPLARNEWICWNVSVKLAETRKEHIERTIEELQEGKRRPCCWIGCMHRKDKALNSTQKWMLSKK